jgi:hypothetical protein
MTIGWLKGRRADSFFWMTVEFWLSGFAQESAGKQPATHGNAPVKCANGEFDATSFQRLSPGQHR